MEVTMPDGTIIYNVPEGTTQADLQSMVPQSFLSKSVDRLRLGATDAMATLAGETYTDEAEPVHLDPSRKVMKALGGDMIPAVGEVAGNAMIEAGKAVLPREAEEAIASGAEYVMSSRPVQALGGAVSAASDAVGPEVSDAVSQSVNMFAALSPKTTLGKTKLGERAAAANAGRIATDRESMVARMLEPDNMDGDGKIITKGPLKRKEYQPVAWEEEMYEEVAKVKGVKPKSNYTDNVNAVESAVERMRITLDTSLDGVPDIPLAEIKAAVAEAVEEVAKSPRLVGNAGDAAKRIYAMFDDLVEEAGADGVISARALLQARRDLDNLLTGEKASIFEGAATAYAHAGAKLRKVINGKVAEVAPSAEVLESLAKQSKLLSARDIMSPRSVKEKGNAITRIIDDLERSSGVKHPTTPQSMQITATNPIVGIGAALLAGGWGIAKALTNSTRASYVRLLKEVDRVIDVGGEAATQLRLDRVVLVSMLEEEQNKVEE